MATQSYVYTDGNKNELVNSCNVNNYAHTKTWTVEVAGIPERATVNSVVLSFYTETTYTVAYYLRIRVDGVTAYTKYAPKNELRNIDLTNYISGNGTYAIDFQSARYTDKHCVMHFSNISLAIDYTNPASGFTLSQESVEAGGNVTVTIDPVDADYTHRVGFALGERSVTMEAEGTEVMLDIPLEWVDQLPGAESGAGMVTVETFAGGSSMGTTTAALTVFVPPDIVPDPGVLEAALVDGAWGLYVQGHSRCALSLAGYGPGLGSSVSSVLISGGGESAWADAMQSSVLRTPGEVTYTATVRDARGREASTTATIHVESYAGVSITARTAMRCLADGTPDRTGESALLGVSYTMTSLGDNAAEVQIYWREYGTEGWTAIDGWPSASGVVQAALLDAVSASGRYEIRFVVRDALSVAEQTAVIAPGSAYMVWHKDGRAWGFGCFPEGENIIRIADDIALYLGNDELREWVKAQAPALAAVATSGDYADLLNAPTPAMAYLFSQGSGYLDTDQRISCTADAWTTLASYEMTIPKTGKYLVIGAVGMTCTGTSAASGHFRVQVNGVDATYPNVQGWGIPPQANVFTGAQINDVMSLSAGTHTFTLCVWTSVKTVCYGYRLQLVEVMHQ